MSEEEKKIALQMEKLISTLPQLLVTENMLFNRMGLPNRTLITPAVEAVWSTHDIARHLLTLADKDITPESEYGWIVIDEEYLPEPKIAAVDAVWKTEPNSNHASNRMVSSRPERIPFHWVKS